jgi:hypothetical protein
MGLDSGNGCYHSVQNLLSSRLLSKNIKSRIYKSIILPVVLYEGGTWSLTLSEVHRQRVYQVKEDELGRACSTNGENRNAYRIL